MKEEAARALPERTPEDSDTERRVLDALERASEGRTVLSISHRTEARASGGRIIAVGEEN